MPIFPKSEVTLTPRKVTLTTRKGVEVRRTLPHRDIFMIGAWAFVDHYGPTTSEEMSVGAHPHIGLQTASWLFSGEIEHRDSLGSVQLITPGQLNLMTAGRGIAHSELSLESAPLHGVQLWIALPHSDRSIAPNFDHHDNLPVVIEDGITFQVFVGNFLGSSSPATIYSELVGVEISAPDSRTCEIPTRVEFEYGILVDQGSLTINGQKIDPGQLHYIPAGRDSIHIETQDNFRILLLGGTPFEEEIVMWWNFIASSHEEIVQARKAWEESSSRFPSFEDNIHKRIPAPEMPNVTLTPRPRSRVR